MHQDPLWANLIRTGTLMCPHSAAHRNHVVRVQSLEVTLTPNWYIAKCFDATDNTAYEVHFQKWAPDFNLDPHIPQHPALIDVADDPRQTRVADKICREIDSRYTSAGVTAHGALFRVRCGKNNNPADGPFNPAYFYQDVRYPKAP